MQNLPRMCEVRFQNIKKKKTVLKLLDLVRMAARAHYCTLASGVIQKPQHTLFVPELMPEL